MPSRIVHIERGDQVKLQIVGAPAVGGIVDLGAAEADCSTTVSCTLVRVRSRSAAISGSTTVTCTLVTSGTQFLTATASGSTTVSASLTRVRARTAAISGSTTVTANVVRTRARSATSTGTTTVTCTLVTSGVKLFTATANGSTTVTASLPPQTEQPLGGFVVPKRPPVRTRTLRPRHATVRVTAFAPRLTVIASPGLGTVRMRTFAPAPTLVFQASAVSSETLGQLPRSKRDLLDKLVIYDTV